jgi:Cdc6-like AAA superfamily ATPase
MIADARALREEPLPEELVHRTDKLQVLLTALHGLEGPLGDNAGIFGPSGAGKTTMARMASRTMEQEHMEIETVIVDCLSHSTTATALHAICQQLGVDGGLQYGSSPVAEYRDTLAGVDEPVLVTVDEANHLDSLELVHILYELPDVSSIVIAPREEELLAHADQRIASRFRSGVRISLDAYSDQELVDILQQRVDAALVEDIVDDEGLLKMAQRSDGNAREAIWHLRYAIKHLQGSDADRVTVDIVQAISPAAKDDLISRVFSRLDRPHRVLCELLFEHGEMRAGALHEQFEAALDESISDRTRQRVIGELRDGSGADLVEQRGSGPATRYRLTDRVEDLFEKGELP